MKVQISMGLITRSPKFNIVFINIRKRLTFIFFRTCYGDAVKLYMKNLYMPNITIDSKEPKSLPCTTGSHLT